MQQRVKKIIIELAKKHDLTFAETEFAIRTFYKKVKEELEVGNYPEVDTFRPILIPHFGRFIPNVHKIKRVANGDRENQFRKHFIEEGGESQSSPISGIQDRESNN